MLISVTIPEAAILLVKKNESITFGSPLYGIKKSTQISVPIAKYLGIKPQSIFQHAQVVVGATIAVGDILAQTKKLFGMKKVKAEQAGTVVQIDHETGSIGLTVASDQDKTQPAFFTGKVVDIPSPTLLSVDIGKGDIYAAAHSTQDFGGKRMVYKEGEYFAVDGDEINESVILVKHILAHIETKMDALGAEGIIYLEGETPTSLPSARCASEKDFDALVASKNTYIYCSSHEDKIIAYNG